MNKKVSKKNKALIFSAHPDDHICAAGTLMFLKDKGFIIEEVVATGGEKGIWWKGEEEKKTDFDKSDLREERSKELEEASNIIGINKTINLGLPDSEVKRSFAVVDQIAGIIRKERPDFIFAMNTHDYHWDHREFSQIVVEGAERASWSYQPEQGEPYKVPVVLMAEGFYFGKSHVVVDVSKYTKRKASILDVYKSQIEEKERKLLDDMDSYHSFFARDKKVTAVEAFELPFSFPVDLNKVADVFASK